MTIENRAILLLKKKVRQRAPLLLPMLGQLHARTIGYRAERKYFKDLDKIGEGEGPKSLILLSVNRAATQFTEGVIAEIFRHAGGQYLALNRYLFFADKNAETHMLDESFMKDFFKLNGYFYGQVGPFSDYDFLKRLRVISMVRDPRDLAVSHFHSFTKAHTPRDKKFIEEMHAAQEMGLDAFVTQESFMDQLEVYFRQAVVMKKREDSLFWRYEDMMDNFDGFQSSVQEFVLGEVNARLSEHLMGRFRGPQQHSGGSEMSHRRSGRWGQFREHLGEASKQLYEERFRPYLLEFGYGANSYR